MSVSPELPDSSESTDPAKPPLTTTTSLWPAAAILIMAVVMLGVFLAVDFVTSKGVVPTPTTVPVVVGTLSRDTHPTAALKYCQQSEEVPSNLDNSFIVPVNTEPRSGANTPDLGAGEFDCIEPMQTTQATGGQIIKFFDAQLESRGWSCSPKVRATATRSHSSKRPAVTASIGRSASRSRRQPLRTSTGPSRSTRTPTLSDSLRSQRLAL